MNIRTITAVFDRRADAEQARDQLRALGIPEDGVRIVDQQTTTTGITTEPERHRGLWETIKDFFLPDEDRYLYEEGVRRGGFLLTARVLEDQADRAISILESCNAVDLDRREQEWRAAGWQPTQALAERTAAPRPDRGTDRGTSAASEEVIPIVEERLRVGKREVQRGGARVRSYIVEEPVHEQVRLREEHVDIERRPVNQPLRAGANADDLLRERTLDVTETAEEPVVSREAVVKEEVAVRRRAEERVEDVSDTVRRTEVEVQDTHDEDLGKLAARRRKPAEPPQPRGRPH